MNEQQNYQLREEKEEEKLGIRFFVGIYLFFCFVFPIISDLLLFFLEEYNMHREDILISITDTCRFSFSTTGFHLSFPFKYLFLRGSVTFDYSMYFPIMSQVTSFIFSFIFISSTHFKSYIYLL